MTEQQPGNARFDWGPEAVDRSVLSIPEGTLTEVRRASDGELLGHAEVRHNGDGTGTITIYGLTHNPEEQS